MNAAAEPLGQRLQAARERKGLSAQKAADELHLDGWVIEGLESGNYLRIGPPVYAKGHLKRYAELLGLPVADVLADFDGTPVEIPPPAQPAGMRMRTAAPVGSDLPWPVIGGLAVAAVVLAGVLWWRPWHARVTAPPAARVDASAADMAAGASSAGLSAMPPPRGPGAGAAAPSTVNGAIAPGAGSSGAAPSGKAPAGATGSPASTSAATSGVAAVPDPKAASGRARLRLSFLADSWVDVHDANGQRLYAGNGHVNNVRSMSGEAPFRVYLKSAASIRMEINNHVVTIGPQFVVGDAAHFEAGADGVLRRDPHATPAK